MTALNTSHDASSTLVPSAGVDVVLTSDFPIDNTVFAAGSCALELYIGTGGTVIAAMLDDAPGVTHTYKNVPSGSTLAGKFVLVKSTGNGTTAADIIARR